MDKTTTWLIRGAAAVVIAVGITGIGVMLDSLGLIDFSKDQKSLIDQEEKLRLRQGNLGEAETGKRLGVVPPKTYEIWCGMKGNDCKVTFDGTKLRVNDGQGITNDQTIYTELSTPREGNLWLVTYRKILVVYKKIDSSEARAEFFVKHKEHKALQDQFESFTGKAMRMHEGRGFKL